MTSRPDVNVTANGSGFHPNRGAMAASVDPPIRTDPPASGWLHTTRKAGP